MLIMWLMKPMREMYARVATAETWNRLHLATKHSLRLIKNVNGVALEPQRRALWESVLRDERGGALLVVFGQLAARIW